MKIKDLSKDGSLGGVKFKHPETGEVCIWRSQWGYPNGKAGIWYKKPEDKNSDKIYPLQLNSLEEALEFEIVKEEINE